MWDIIGATAVFWAMGVVSYDIYRKSKKKDHEIDFVANLNKQLVNVTKQVYENQSDNSERISFLVKKIEEISKSNEEAKKIVQEAKDLLSKNNLVGAFVPRSKRIEIGN